VDYDAIISSQLTMKRKPSLLFGHIARAGPAFLLLLSDGLSVSLGILLKIRRKITFLEQLEYKASDAGA